MFILIFNAIFPLILVALVGFILKKLDIAKDSWIDTLNTLALYTLFPALILRGIGLIRFDGSIDFSFIVINLILLLLIIASLYFGSKLFRLSKKLTNTYVTAVFFANIGYLGYPIITSLIAGSEAVVSIHIAIYTTLLFSVVLAILEYSKEGQFDKRLLLNIIKNPLILSVIIALILTIFKIKLPFVVSRAIDILADGATPTVLIALGIFLAIKIPKVKKSHLITLIMLKLIVMPSIFLIIYFIYPIKEFAISVLESAMPIAITPFVLSKFYPLDSNLIVASIVISTILSLISLPIFIIAIGV